ncbi:glycosyltransferase [Planobispora longispora]|uniref:Glycosyl transferase n=1 Tax=Planobispora longispora TaxID=28887 RepID=A0A8J3RD63_9ACTN|nr:glycosyltransferase [Planobispora longispora]BFE77521.1 glycosyltransferase family 1 protein [Planobispora longispora]GIH73961.1 glycosyl transferase [Planobispora longispora]
MNIAFVSSDALSATQDQPVPSAHRNQILAVARELGREHKVTIYTRRGADSSKTRVRVAHGVTMEHLPAGPAQDLPEDGVLPYLPDMGSELMRRWGQNRPDVIHAHSWTGGLAALAGASGLHVPVTQTFTRQTGGDARKARLQRALGRRADAVIAGCGDEESELIRLGVPRRNIAVIPCGVDVERFRRQGPAAPRGTRARLLHVGPLSDDRGVRTAIRALAGIPDAELLVAGGPAASDLEHDADAYRVRMLAKELGVDDRVSLLGQVPHASVPKLMRSADVVLSLPREAAGGVVALEAMACGVPVIASAVGAHMDSVVDGVTGLLVAPDRPAQTARLARELLADPTRRTALGFAAADRVRSRYSWERISQELVRVYEDALAAQR